MLCTTKFNYYLIKYIIVLIWHWQTHRLQIRIKAVLYVFPRDFFAPFPVVLVELSANQAPNSIKIIPKFQSHHVILGSIIARYVTM